MAEEWKDSYVHGLEAGIEEAEARVEELEAEVVRLRERQIPKGTIMVNGKILFKPSTGEHALILDPYWYDGLDWCGGVTVYIAPLRNW